MGVVYYWSTRLLRRAGRIMTQNVVPFRTSRQRRPGEFDQRLREIGMFFQGTDPVHRTMRRVSEALEAAGIPYAIVGGMAVNAHRHARTTGDVDFLLRSDGFDAFHRLLGPGRFEQVPGRPRRFLDPSNGITFDILVTGLFPGSGKPGPIAYPDPAEVSEMIDGKQVVNLPTLIQLKLAASRYQDFADVVNLIGRNDLDESFLEKLHPSVRGDFIECLEEKRREDEYEARQDEAFEKRKSQTPDGPSSKSGTQ